MNSERFFVRESSFIDDDVDIGADTEIGHFCHIQSGTSIGMRCVFGQTVNVSRDVIIGDDVIIQNNVSVCEGVEIENGVFCESSCTFTNDLSSRVEFLKSHEKHNHTILRHHASIGAKPNCGRI